MTATMSRRGEAGAPGWDHPVERAQLPDRSVVETALAKIRAWTPYDGDAWLDDVADVLDSVPPGEDRVDELALRLRGYLMQLVGFAVNSGADRKDDRAFPLIARARQVREEEIPGDYPKALVHLRKMGWAVNELHDLLFELGAVSGPDSLHEDLARSSPAEHAMTPSTPRPPGRLSMSVEIPPHAPADLDHAPNGAPIVRTLATRLPGDPRALQLARTWTRRSVTFLGWQGNVQQAVEVVSRLVDNGVRHGMPDNLPQIERQLTLSVSIDQAGALITDVADLNPAFPDFEAAVSGEKGRGLWQVAYLGARVTRFLPYEGTGKTVRAVLAPGPVDL
ncbi:DUF6415 family natural product biosynthesis protein [Streptomyces lavendulocolor]|uniref:DUF6415 family natural product biosynthesis protein n=1 Tax=Streptomyces lavendulocolor TaxID=67316 RepID=UPI003C2D551C